MAVLTAAQQCQLDRIRIVMVNTSHPGNIGAAARAMKNMGLRRLVLVDPATALGDEAYRRSAGAEAILSEAMIVNTLAEGLAGCAWVAGTSARLRSVQWPVHLPRECAEIARKKSAQGDVAIVFGRERVGLTNAELELCNALVHIPTDPDYSSLNVAAAVQVLCYELRLAQLDNAQPLASSSKKHRDDVPADSELMQGMYQHLYQTLEDVKFFGTHNPEVVMRRLKGLFNRAQTTVHEVAILRGIFSAAQGRKAKRSRITKREP
jgi:tRNA (cytidine32/uridine32-2'-O)-methyltransferase